MLAVPATSRTQTYSTQHHQIDLIKSTIVRIATSTDCKDWNLMRDQFAESVLVHSETGIPAIHMPSSKLVDWATYVFQSVESSHFLSNIEVHFNAANPGQAETVSYWRAVHRSPASPCEGARLIHSRCQHTLIRTEDGWKVTEIRTISLEDQNQASAPHKQKTAA